MNNGGNWGAIDLHDYAMGGWLDCGTYPDWLEETELYFDDTINSDVNVVMWSWCGQVADKYKAGKLWSEYLGPMTDLESKYPDIVFVYMTGHVDIADDLYNKAANDSIRSFCLKNGKVLYDFADIERWDPDGYYYEYVNDNCDYYNSNYNKLGNWATEWQGSHVEGIDWFECNSAHSQPLNANQKAYAAWWLFARLGGWVPSMEITNNNDGKSIRIFRLEQNYPNPFNSHTSIDYQLFRKRDVTLEIYNITGEKIVEIVHKEQLPGMYTIDWNSFDVSSGVYVYKLTTNNFSKTKKMLLLK